MSATANNPGPTEVTAQQAYARAGVGPNDIHCLEVQDTDAFCELEIYEELGLCAMGGSGGLISKGEPVGASHIGQLVEIVSQLRHQAGPRQVPGASLGLAHVLGAGGNCAVTILSR